jgi:biotin operon repressor
MTTLNETTLNLLLPLVSGARKVSKLSAKQAVVLASQGLLGINEEGSLSLTAKAPKAVQSHYETLRQEGIDQAVAYALGGLLAESPNGVKHRTVWETVGREEASRSQVLKSLKTLRSLGAVETICPSGNNFQQRWVRNPEYVA